MYRLIRSTRAASVHSWNIEDYNLQRHRRDPLEHRHAWQDDQTAATHLYFRYRPRISGWNVQRPHHPTQQHRRQQPLKRLTAEPCLPCHSYLHPSLLLSPSNYLNPTITPVQSGRPLFFPSHILLLLISHFPNHFLPWARIFSLAPCSIFRFDSIRFAYTTPDQQAPNHRLADKIFFNDNQ